MNARKWTPGPWSEHGKGGCECGQIFGPDGNAVIAIVQGPMHLGPDSPDCVPNREAQQANAALIAAAPELYEALWAILDAHDGTEGRRFAEEAARGRAALAKARGDRS